MWKRLPCFHHTVSVKNNNYNCQKGKGKKYPCDFNDATGNTYNDKTIISCQDNCSHLPQPPHVSILVREKAAGVITAVLEVTKATAEKRSGVAVRPGARESRHQHVIFAPVAIARRAHRQPMWRARGWLSSPAHSVRRRWVSPLCVVAKQ